MKKRTMALLLIIIFALSSVFTGCSSSLFGNDGEQTPSSVMQGAYGNEQFTITFSSEGLDAPLENMTYSAYNMPTLPTPERVGYIFEGWYLDSAFTIPYLDGILYLYMTDVTLYAKWSAEEFVQNGTYDIDFEAHIVEGTVVEGQYTQIYGGYRDISEDIVADNTYIMKSDDGLYLQIQYDSLNLPDYMYANDYPVYLLSISSSPEYRTSARLDTTMTIDSYSDSVKTIYIDISNFDIADSLYLNVSYINWEAENLDIGTRAETLTTYVLEFNITRLIGFSQSFADPDSTLDDGYYLAKTYYRSEDNSSNMGSSFNPVYSYIIAEDGHYTLVKPFIPYAGLVESAGTSGEFDDYYNRLMTFMPVQLYYDIDTSSYGENTVESDYYPETYGGGSYGIFSLEYNAETGRCYAIYDLGTDLKTEYMVMSATSGFMEYNYATGYGNQILSIDYEHLVKQTEIDYVPLEGDAYTYQTEMQYYPGFASDLNSRNLTYDSVEDLGISTLMYNFFWSALSADSSYSSRTIHSSRITITPTVSTQAVSVADSRYRIAYFYVNTEIYGYDVQDGTNLYADVMEVDSFTGSEETTFTELGFVTGFSMRRTLQMRVGKSYNIGDTVNIASLYAEKVDADNILLSGVTYTIYDLNADGSVDWGSGRTPSSATFTFSSNVAVLFTSTKTDDSGNSTGNRTTLVEIVQYEDPVVTIDGYVENETYLEGSSVSFPTVTYTWMGVSGEFCDLYYAGSDDQLNMDPTRVAIYNVENGIYYLRYPTVRSSTFTMLGDSTILVFELQNAYGERYYVYLDYSSEAIERYAITDSSGEELINESLSYNSSGERRAISDNYYYFISDFERFTEIPSFYMSIGGSSEVQFELSEVTVWTGTDSLSLADNEIKIDSINDFISAYGGDYALVQFNYVLQNADGIEDSLSVYYMVNSTVSGQKQYSMLKEEDYFSGYTYTISKPQIMSGESGISLSTGSLTVQKYAGDDLLSNSSSTYLLTDLGSSYELVFNEAGTYRITYSYTLSYNEAGDRVFDGIRTRTIYFYQTIEVQDGDGDITITYVTDEGHPFADGSTQMTVTYNLNSSIITLDSTYFNYSGEDVLYGWASREDYTFVDTDYLYYSGRIISDYIGAFGSREITLYAIWDPGITITLVVNGDAQESEKYYLSTGSLSAGYRVDVYYFGTPTAPGNTVFVGWTGGFIGDDIVTSQPYTITDISEENLTIYAVFENVYTVSFDTNATYTENGRSDYYTSSTFRSEQVTDGDTIADPESKQNLNCSREGYEFKGWYVQGDESQTLVDLSEYEVTGNVTFVALFGPIEE